MFRVYFVIVKVIVKLVNIMAINMEGILNINLSRIIINKVVGKIHKAAINILNWHKFIVDIMVFKLKFKKFTN